MSTDTPITKREMEGLLHGVHQRLDNYEKRFDRLETSLNQRCDHLDDLIETVATEVSSVQVTLLGHEQRFDRLETSLNQRCDHLDDLVETVASEVNSISTILEPLVPVQHDHEQRISRLERGYTRLILKS